MMRPLFIPYHKQPIEWQIAIQFSGQDYNKLNPVAREIADLLLEKDFIFLNNGILSIE